MRNMLHLHLITRASLGIYIYRSVVLMVRYSPLSHVKKDWHLEIFRDKPYTFKDLLFNFKVKLS